MTKDYYVFDLSVGDSGDELSEQFNPKNPNDVKSMEDWIKESLEDAGINVSYVGLKKVVVDYP